MNRIFKIIWAEIKCNVFQLWYGLIRMKHYVQIKMYSNNRLVMMGIAEGKNFDPLKVTWIRLYYHEESYESL